MVLSSDYRTIGVFFELKNVFINSYPLGKVTLSTETCEFRTNTQTRSADPRFDQWLG